MWHLQTVSQALGHGKRGGAAVHLTFRKSQVDFLYCCIQMFLNEFPKPSENTGLSTWGILKWLKNKGAKRSVSRGVRRWGAVRHQRYQELLVSCNLLRMQVRAHLAHKILHQLNRGDSATSEHLLSALRRQALRIHDHTSSSQSSFLQSGFAPVMKTETCTRSHR